MKQLAVSMLFLAVAPSVAMAGGIFGIEGIIKELSIPAETGIKPYALEVPASEVQVDFEGGIVGSNMAQVLRGLYEAGTLPLKRKDVANPTGLCSLLATSISLRAGYCAVELIAVIEQINRDNGISIRPDGIVGPVLLPIIEVEEYTFRRYFDTSYGQERDQALTIGQSAAWDTIKGVTREINNTAGLPGVIEQQFTGTRWTLSIPGDSPTAFSHLYGLSLPNVTIAVDDPARIMVDANFDEVTDNLFSSQAHSALDLLKDWCELDGPFAVEGSFAEYLTSKYDTPSPSCEPVLPTFVVADGNIIVQSDIAPSLLPPNQAAQAVASFPTPVDCKPQIFSRPLHHGNLILGILASQQNGYAFQGLSPGAPVFFHPWGERLDMNALWRFFRIHEAPVTPQVYILPFKFPDFRKASAGASAAELDLLKRIWAHDPDVDPTAANEFGFKDELSDEDSRFLGNDPNAVLNRFILDRSASLFVVAAGRGGLQLRAQTAVSPQNLGDLKNVVVVGGCADCGTNAAKVSPESNFSSPGGRFVHLLAPDVEKVPVFLEANSAEARITYAEEGGTSAASAFVGGVAGNLRACYSRFYAARPDQVKLRLIVSSRPLHDQEDAEKVAGGVVDPGVAMLDPMLTWLKLREAEVASVTFGRWCTEALRVTGADGLVDMAQVARVTDEGFGQYVVTTVSRIGGDGPHKVRRFGPGTIDRPSEMLAVVDQGDGECGVGLNDVEDLLLPADTLFDAGSCEAVQPCGG